MLFASIFTQYTYICVKQIYKLSQSNILMNRDEQSTIRAEAGRSGAWRKQEVLKEGGSRVYSVCCRSVLGSPWVANVM